MLYDPIYMTFWKKQSYRDGKQMGGCQRVRFGDGVDYEGIAGEGRWCCNERYLTCFLFFGAFEKAVSQLMKESTSLAI